jgi:hypothetical protein
LGRCCDHNFLRFLPNFGVLVGLYFTIVEADVMKTSHIFPRVKVQEPILRSRVTAPAL